MPIFEYLCKNCRKNFELKVDFGYEGKPKCSFCKSDKAEKLISVPGIIFKGSGFYKTDSREKKPEPKAATSSDKNAPTASEKPAPKETKAEDGSSTAKTTENRPAKQENEK